MHELKKRDYEKVRPLFKELEWNLITNAVIERTSPGRIYADSVENPETAFMCTVEGYYLAGRDSNDEFNASLNRLIFESMHGTSAWNKILRKIQKRLKNH